MIIKYFHDSNWTNDVASFLTKFVKRNKKKNLRLILTGGNSSKLINKQIIENLNTDCRLNIYLSDERCTKFANKDSLNQTFFKTYHAENNILRQDEKNSICQLFYEWKP